MSNLRVNRVHGLLRVPSLGTGFQRARPSGRCHGTWVTSRFGVVLSVSTGGPHGSWITGAARLPGGDATQIFLFSRAILAETYSLLSLDRSVGRAYRDGHNS